MKFRSLENWTDAENSKGLILFAQMIDELLFAFTLDTYKPSAMNTSLLIQEALAIQKAIESGAIKRPNLGHIIDELCENLDRDPVAKSLLAIDLGGIKAIIKNPKSTDHSIKTCLELIGHQIPLNLYRKRNEELLIESICGSQNPNEIRGLTRSYITTLLNDGFSERYIQDKARAFFHYSGNKIDGNTAIREYLNIFSHDLEEYHAIYRAPDYLRLFDQSAKLLDIEITTSKEEFDPLLNHFNFQLGQNEVYLIIRSSAKEPYSAKKLTDASLDQFHTLIGLYHHRKKALLTTSEALIIFPSTRDGKKLSTHFNPMHKCRDLKAGTAAKRLEVFVDKFSMERASFLRFNRSAELHALALGSDSTENQLINLWIALESLIPSKSDDELSQIEHISKSLMPFLNHGYIQKIITRLSKDLFLWNSRLSKKILRQVDGLGVIEKTTRLLAIPKYTKLRTELIDKFDQFHLLRERFTYVELLLSSPEKLAKALDAHKKRVDWQIRRIYRARNLIVHEGVTPSYTETLIENAHDYLDCVFNSLMQLASKENVLNTIDQGFTMVSISYDSYYKQLNAKDLTFEEENISSLLFETYV